MMTREHRRAKDLAAAVEDVLQDGQPKAERLPRSGGCSSQDVPKVSDCWKQRLALIMAS